MFGDPDAFYRLEHDMTLLSSVEWRDLADVFESRALNEHGDYEQARYFNETSKLLEAVARWRQMYAEVTA